MKTNLNPWKPFKTDMEPWKTNPNCEKSWKPTWSCTGWLRAITGGYRRLEGGSNHFSLQTNTNQQCRSSHLPGWQADEPGASTNLLWSKKRYVTNTGPQPTSFGAKSLCGEHRAPTDEKMLIFCYSRGDPTDLQDAAWKSAHFSSHKLFVTHRGSQLTSRTQLEKVLIFRPIHFFVIHGESQLTF